MKAFIYFLYLAKSFLKREIIDINVADKFKTHFCVQ